MLLAYDHLPLVYQLPHRRCRRNEPPPCAHPYHTLDIGSEGCNPSIGRLPSTSLLAQRRSFEECQTPQIQGTVGTAQPDWRQNPRCALGSRALADVLCGRRTLPIILLHARDLTVASQAAAAGVLSHFLLGRRLSATPLLPAAEMGREHAHRSNGAEGSSPLLSPRAPGRSGGSFSYALREWGHRCDAGYVGVQPHRTLRQFAAGAACPVAAAPAHSLALACAALQPPSRATSACASWLAGPARRRASRTSGSGWRAAGGLCSAPSVKPAACKDERSPPV